MRTIPTVLGLMLASFLSPVLVLSAPVAVVACDCSDIPAPTAPTPPMTLTLTGHCDGENFDRENALTGVVFPKAELAWSFADLPNDRTCYFRVPDLVVNGETFFGRTLVRAATAPPPAPTPTPNPPTQQSANGTKAVTVTDAAGNVWTLNGNITLKNGVEFGTGRGSMYLYYSPTVYVLGVDGQWYRAGVTMWELVGAEPTAPAPTPTPTVDLTPVLNAIAAQAAAQAQQTQALLTAIGALKPPPAQPPAICTTSPLKVIVTSWPSSAIGSRTGRWDSGTFTLVDAAFTWMPSLRFSATDTRGCSTVVIK